MKIWCDVCDKEEATVFCSADEAALCEGCDVGVHHANKLATKHSRFSLLHPSSNEFPLCDICQERRAFLFCQEDRAMFCRECDVSIHRANEITQKHNRFLLTGVKLSPSLSLNPTSSSSETKSSPSHSSKWSRFSLPNNQNFTSPMDKSLASTSTTYRLQDNASISTSNNISEYLMEKLPGWNVDDFPDPSSGGDANGFCKIFKQGKGDYLGNNMAPFSSSEEIWVFEVFVCGWTRTTTFFFHLSFG
ncbi:hypothetical protein ES332_A13G034300v1 [Gossypium tomentosum]|uniref:B box-type domain-containing protein n=1 Tax=Gossypium tomentosum TaxID=34277 RepID=A0A5D2MFI1_GOSTO|nr:hypothetical protein ES332_A13G034300v1 [Gossypium tomentosum]